MGKYHELAELILKNIGGRGNINAVTHCITRLRFKLKDQTQANDDSIKNLNGVVTVMKSGGQYQIVIGNHVPKVYEELLALSGISFDTEQVDSEENIFNRLIDILSGCFQPFLGALAAAGMVKGFNALFIFFQCYSKVSGTYTMLNGIGDAIFFFMPVILGHTAAKKFNLNPMVGIVVGAVMCYPNLQSGALQTTFEQTAGVGTSAPYNLFGLPAYDTFLGIPWVGSTYTSSVIPVIFIVAFAAKIQNISRKIIPEIVQTFLVPFFVLLISLPVGFLVIGPVISVLTDLLSTCFQTLMSFSPAIYGFILGLVWQILVIFGLHWSVIPLSILQITQYGFSQVLVASFSASFAQTAVVIAMFFKFKNKKLKALCPPAIISGVFGVTEPAIYGITLPQKRPFFFSMIGAAVGGLYMMINGVTSYTMGGLGILGFLNFIDGNNAVGILNAVIAVIIAMAIGFTLTFFFWHDHSNVEEIVVINDAQKVRREIITSPINGFVLPLNRAGDQAFAHGILGQGVLVEPNDGVVRAPFNGTVVTLFPTNHAIGIISEQGMELLIHIGMDTVQLNGEGFEAKVGQGDKIEKGQILVIFDIEGIRKAGYSIETPIIITNSDDYLDIIETQEQEVNYDDILITGII